MKNFQIAGFGMVEGQVKITALFATTQKNQRLGRTYQAIFFIKAKYQMDRLFVINATTHLA
jgi:hypothetical protein